ncbi:TPA: hypothetical protein ACS7WR_003644 [Providencia alcalifaciens]
MAISIPTIITVVIVLAFCLAVAMTLIDEYQEAVKAYQESVRKNEK